MRPATRVASARSNDELNEPPMPRKKITVSTLPRFSTTRSMNTGIFWVADALKLAAIRKAFDRSASFGNDAIGPAERIVTLLGPPAPFWKISARQPGSFGMTTREYAVRPCAAVLKMPVLDDTDELLGRLNSGESTSAFSVRSDWFGLYVEQRGVELFELCGPAFQPLPGRSERCTLIAFAFAWIAGTMTFLGSPGAAAATETTISETSATRSSLTPAPRAAARPRRSPASGRTAASRRRAVRPRSRRTGSSGQASPARPDRSQSTPPRDSRRVCRSRFRPGNRRSRRSRP